MVLFLANYGDSSFDVVLSNLQQPYTHVHSLEVLGELLRVLKPSGKFVFRAAIGTGVGEDLRYSSGNLT